MYYYFFVNFSPLVDLFVYGCAAKQPKLALSQSHEPTAGNCSLGFSGGSKVYGPIFQILT